MLKVKLKMVCEMLEVKSKKSGLTNKKIYEESGFAIRNRN